MNRRLIAVLTLLAACGREASRSGGNSLQYYLGADPASLDPALSTDVQTGEMVTLLFDNLVQFDADARLQPGIASRWEVDPSGRIYTSHLRSGVSFHDGRPVGAREVRASLLGRAAWPISSSRRSPWACVRWPSCRG